MNYYVENNLENSLPKIFGSSSAMSLEAYYCENVWEVVMQDGCGNEIMNVNNCDPNHPKLDCSKIIPSIPSTTTAGPTVGPTVGPTTGPTAEPPADIQTAFFLDYLNWAGNITYTYVYQKVGMRMIHTKTTQGNLSNMITLLGRNGRPDPRSGTGLFWWTSPEMSNVLAGTAPSILYNGSISLAIAHPGLQISGRPDNRTPFFIDPSLPSPEFDLVTLKAYAELDDGSQFLAADQLISFLSLGGTDNLSEFRAPFLMYNLWLGHMNFEGLGTTMFRLELSCDLGTEIMYVPFVRHPEWHGCLSLESGSSGGNSCDYEVV